MMTFSKGAIAGYLGLVFASGAAVGGFGTRLYTVSTVAANIGKGTIQSPEEMRKHFVNDMRARLKLLRDIRGEALSQVRLCQAWQTKLGRREIAVRP